MKLFEILNATNGNLTKGNKDYFVEEIVIDSRKSKEKSLYISIVGKNLDGHTFMENAYQNGCKTFIKNKDSIINIDYYDINLIEVDDTEKALGDISKYYKEKFDIPFVSVTGSVGKTTTRDMIHSVLSSKFKTLKNEGNLNNSFGVPLTLFNLNSTYESAVIEMGMSGFNEIKYLSDIVNPNIAVITNIGSSHIENLGSREGIFKAKMEIISNFSKDNTLIVNGDDDFLKLLKEKSLEYDLKTFGFGKNNDIYYTSYEIFEDKTKFNVIIDEKEQTFEIPLPGKHNIYNAMASILVGKTLGLTLDEIRNGLLNFKITKMRLDIIKSDKLTIINDAYNASVESMKASIEVLTNYKQRKVAILGDMFELGEYEEAYHKSVGEFLINKVDVLITIGKSARFIYEEALSNGFLDCNSHYFNTKDEAIKCLDKIIKNNDVILIKASRGMKLEELINHLNK